MKPSDLRSPRAAGLWLSLVSLLWGCGPLAPGADGAAGGPAAVAARRQAVEVLGALERAHQGVTVQVSAIGAGDLLTLELWSDGSATEVAGNGLQLAVGADGRTRFAARLGGDLIVLGSDLGADPMVSGLPLRLRLRLEGTSAVLHLDTQQGSTWQPDAARYTFGYTRPLFGRRVVALDRPAGASFEVAPEAPAGALSLHRSYDGLSDWKLFQRSGQSADLPLRFFYRSPVAAHLVVDLLRSADGQPVPGYGQRRFPLGESAGQTAAVTLPAVPQGGDYDLHASLLRDDSGAQLGEDEARDIAVGDVFLAIGQSNMTGFAELSPPEGPIPEVHLFGNDYYWKQAAEPMDSGEDQVDRVSEEVPGHSLMLRFAKEIFSATGVPVAIIPGPRFGTNIDSDWARSDARPEDRGTLYGSAIYRALSQGYAAPIRGVLWWQGEGNAGSGIDNYRDHLAALVRSLRADLGGAGVFFANCQLATNGENMTEENLFSYLEPQEAQRQYALLDRASVVVAMVDLPRGDPYHLSNAGVKLAGARLATAVLRRSYGLSRTLGPVLSGVRFTPGRRDQIEITYNKKIRGGDAGLYRVSDDIGQVTPTSLSRSGSKVTLGLPRGASGATLLGYGYSSDPAAAWIKASDGTGGALVFRDVAVP